MFTPVVIRSLKNITVQKPVLIKVRNRITTAVAFIGFFLKKIPLHLDSDDDEVYAKKYSKELNTPEKRNTFAQKLRAALKQSDNYTESTDSSYAVDISISGSKAGEDGIR